MDHVDLQKKELNHKNDIITDLIQIIKERYNNVAIDNEINKSVAKLDMEHNNLHMEHNFV